MHEDRTYDLYPSILNSYMNEVPRITSIQSTVCPSYFAIELVAQGFNMVVSGGASNEVNIFASYTHD